MFSDALRIMDRNTVWYMIDEEKQERKEAEKRAEGAEKRANTVERKVSEQQEIKKLQSIIAGLQRNKENQAQIKRQGKGNRICPKNLM